MNSDGTSQQRLTVNASSEADPAFSPDGTKIIYVGENDGSGSFGIYTMNLDGSNQTLLIDEGSDCVNFSAKKNRSSERKAQIKKSERLFYPGYLDFETPNYRLNAAPGDEKIVFGYGGIVYTMNPNGSGCLLLYDNTYNFAAEPRYSPDGTKIALVDYFEQGANYYYLKFLDATTGTLINSLYPADFNSNPVWSPDGSKIAFYAGQNFDYDGGLRVETVDVSGLNQTQVFTPQQIPRFSGLSWGIPTTNAPPISLRIDAPHPLSGGRQTQGIVTLDAPAPAGGATISLSYSGEVGIITIPASVVVPAGQTQVSFPIQTTIQTQFRYANINAAFSSNYTTATLTIKPSTPDLRAVSFNAPATIAGSQAFNASWTVENIGEVSTTGTFYTDSIFFSTDNVLDSNDTGFHSTFQSTLAAGGQLTTTESVSLSASNIPQDGNYFLIFVTGSYNSQDEDGRTANNYIVRPVQVTLPDIVAENIVAPAQIEPNVSYTVEWTVRNRGAGATTAFFNNHLYFSMDNIAGNADDLYILSSSVSGLAAGASVVQNGIVNIGTVPARPSGAAFFYVQADGYNNVPEGSVNGAGESNNITFKAVQFNYNVADLQIASITAPPEVETDTPFSIGWTTTNAGNKDAATFSEQVYYSADNVVGSDILLGTFALTNGLAAGQSIDRIQNVTIPTGTIQTGDYYLYVVTDTSSQIDEGVNETNNNQFQPTRVRRFIRPDLTVTNITAPTAAFFDQTIQVQWTVTNSGQGATNTPQWRDSLYIGTSSTNTSGATHLIDATSISALNPGESYTASATVKIPRGLNGAYYFLVATDSGNAVNEENQTNNLLTKAIQINVPPLPDFIVESVQAPAQSFGGAPIDIAYTLKNQGTAATGYGGIERIYFSRDTTLNTSQDRLVFTSDERRTSIGAGATMTRNSSHRRTVCTNGANVAEAPAECHDEYDLVSLPGDLQGLYYVFVVADVYDAVYEYTNENNNINYDRAEPGSPINILISPPDLVVPNQPTAPATAASGQVISVNFTVKNQGAFNAAPNLYHAVYISTDQTFDTGDTLLGSIKDPDFFAAAAEHPFTLNVGLPYCLSNGTYYLFAVADFDKRQFEFDPGYDAEANNASPHGAIQLSTVPPDLLVTNLQTSAITQPGQLISVSWTVTNTGGAATQQRWNDRIILNSTNAQIAPVTLATVEHTGGLAAGAHYSPTRNVGLPAYMQGEYFLSVTTDENNFVSECGTSETNNTTNTTNFTVQNNLPDLVIDAVTIPSAAVVGDTFNVQWTGRNANGAMPANSESWSDTVYLSSNETLDNGDIAIGGASNNSILAGGQTYQKQSIVRTGNVPAGTYYVLVVADSGRSITKARRTLNRSRITCGLRRPLR